MTVVVEKLIPFFTALSHDASGKAIVFDGALDGERVEVETISESKRLIRARLVRVLSSSEDRTEPICPNFMECGGCDLLYMSREREKREKERLFKFFFSQFDPLEILPSVFPERVASRIRATFYGNGKVNGFLRKGSHQVVGIGFCPLLHPSLNGLLSSLAPLPLSINKPFAASRMAFSSIALLGLKYHVSADAFFQSNLECAEALLKFVCDCAKGAETALDAYSGIGFFAKALERQCQEVVAVEENPACKLLAEKNLKRARHLAISLESASWQLQGKPFDFAVIDPPRSGMSAKAFDVVLRLRPKKMVYISCAIDRSIKDILRFADAGYRVVRAQLFDMAPATRRIETACLMELPGVASH